MRWRPYKGERIEVAGHRTFIELPPVIRFGDTLKRYGYVWIEKGSVRAYVELLRPGQVEDLDLGVFGSVREARRSVENALLDPAEATER